MKAWCLKKYAADVFCFINAQMENILVSLSCPYLRQNHKNKNYHNGSIERHNQIYKRYIHIQLILVGTENKTWMKFKYYFDKIEENR